MNNQQRTGILSGAGGSIFGGLCWLVISGFVIKSWPVAVIPVILGAICFYGVMKLYDERPERSAAIMGAAVLFIVVINFIFANMIYDKLPSSLGGMTTGKDSFSISQLNIFFGLLSLLGFGMIIQDIRKKGEKKKEDSQA